MIRDLLLGAGPQSCDFISVAFLALGPLSGVSYGIVDLSTRFF